MPFRTFAVLFIFASSIQSVVYGLTFMLPDLFTDFGGTVGDVGRFLLVVGIVTLVTALALHRLIAAVGRFTGLTVACFACALSLSILATLKSTGPLVNFAAVLMGFGWAAFYILGPIALSQVLTREQRMPYFTWLAAFISTGLGLAPCIGYLGQVLGLAVAHVFLFAAGCTALAAVIFAVLKGYVAQHQIAEIIEEEPLSIRAMRSVLSSQALRPVLMVMLGASVFSSVMNFQTLYSNENDLNYAAFFIVYTVTTIAGRIIVAGLFRGVSYVLMASIFLLSMTIAVLLLVPGEIGNTQHLLAALLFGIGYGLAYPLVKTMAANDASDGLRDATLQLFGLSYFIGIFCFPFVAALVLETFGMRAMLLIAAILAALEFGLAIKRYIRECATHDRKPSRP